jgi:hypothetical protein
VEIFLIHRQSGLLLRHVSPAAESSPDSHAISGMLTAIRDFVKDAFGNGKQGQLEEIEYGEQRILLEATENAYLAVVVEGTQPVGYRAAMREGLIEVEHAHHSALRHYDGDASGLPGVDKVLRTLLCTDD